MYYVKESHAIASPSNDIINSNEPLIMFAVIMGSIILISLPSFCIVKNRIRIVSQITFMSDESGLVIIEETGGGTGRETGEVTGEVTGGGTGRETGEVTGRETGRETGGTLNLVQEPAIIIEHPNQEFCLGKI
jgi:hypothetical protein